MPQYEASISRAVSLESIKSLGEIVFNCETHQSVLIFGLDLSNLSSLMFVCISHKWRSNRFRTKLFFKAVLVWKQANCSAEPNSRQLTRLIHKLYQLRLLTWLKMCNLLL